MLGGVGVDIKYGFDSEVFEIRAEGRILKRSGNGVFVLTAVPLAALRRAAGGLGGGR